LREGARCYARGTTLSTTKHGRISPRAPATWFILCRHAERDAPAPVELADPAGSFAPAIAKNSTTLQRNLSMRVLPLTIVAAVLAVSATAHAAPNVETLPSGVRIEHVKPGTGASPSATSSVTVHYRGTLLNGTEFDSSFKRNQPATFGLNQVIPCWTQGVQKMKVGGTAKLTCPPETAYGSRDLGTIPPNSVLNFEIQLLDSK
jgi:FKBP-type peptidyl-prolyl cis-trans isomerase FkpA